MAYNPAIPQPGDLLSVSQPGLLANFAALNTQYNGDHDGFSSGVSNSGIHKQVSFLTNQSAPSLTINGVTAVSGLFANTGAHDANSQLWFQNATGSQQLTSTASVSGSMSMYTLPSGIKVCITTSDVNFGSAGPSFQLPFTFSSFYTVLVEVSGGTPSILTSVTQTDLRNFRGYSTGGSNAVRFIAIGV